MASNFWVNLDQRRKKVYKERKAIVDECNLAPNAFTTGIKRRSSPTVTIAYACARAVQSSIEELVDGEGGAEYIFNLVQDQGKYWKAPKRFADIAEALGRLNDYELAIIRSALKPMIEKREK
jgi:hypothetical protein